MNWIPTHQMTLTTDRTTIDLVMLHENAGFTREEWNSGAWPSWELDEDREWFPTSLAYLPNGTTWEVEEYIASYRFVERDRIIHSMRDDRELAIEFLEFLKEQGFREGDAIEADEEFGRL